MSSYMFLCFRACSFIGKHVLQFIVIACLCVSSPCSTALHKTQYQKCCNCIEANSRNPLNLFKEGRMCVCVDQGNEFHELSEYIKKKKNTKYKLPAVQSISSCIMFTSPFGAIQSEAACLDDHYLINVGEQKKINCRKANLSTIQ